MEIFSNKKDDQNQDFHYWWEKDVLVTGVNDLLNFLVVILDREGRIIYINRFCNNITGLSSESASDQHFWDIFCPYEERELYKAFFSTLDPAQFPFEIETQLSRKDGSTVTVLWTYNYLAERDNEITYYVLTGIDITSCRKSREELQEKAEKYKAIIYAAPVSVVSLDKYLQIKSWSSGTENLLGWPEREVLNKKIYHYFEDNKGSVYKHAKKTLKGRMFKHLELKCYSKDDKLNYLYLSLAPLRDYKGEVDGLVMVAIDISEKKKAEMALQASEKKYREILSTMEEGYYEIDLEGNFVFFNDSFCRMLDCPQEELVEENYNKIFLNPQDFYEALHRVYFSGKPVKAVGGKVKNKKGDVIYLECSISLREDEEGEELGFRGVARDVTVQKRAEERIRYLSFHDALTGLYNRAYLEEEMQRLDTKRQLPLSIIMIDLNGLKLINDTYGHNQGDELLKKSTDIIKSSCRKEDIIARWGGDEFVILLTKTGEKELESICKRIKENCHEAFVKDIPVSFAIGAGIKKNMDRNLEGVLKEAEDKMYKEKLAESRSARSAVLNTLLKTLSAKSYETELHTQRMLEAAMKIGKRIGLPDSELNRLNLVITLHDIGKINIPEETLTKKGHLTEEEWQLMKNHPEIGSRIAMATEEFAHVAKEILSHHERWDGQGYPRGLKGEEIPLLARITAIVDAYEVMSNGRPYKKALSEKKVINELKRYAGTQFDPELIEVFLSILREA